MNIRAVKDKWSDWCRTVFVCNSSTNFEPVL
jgi:hypothetical protein